MAKEKLVLNIVNQSPQPCPRKWAQLFHRDIIHLLAKSSAVSQGQKKRLHRDLTVVFLGLKAARQLNLQYRGRDYATDVLSFSYPEDHGTLGDLVFCSAVLGRQAKENAHSQRAEFCYLLIHGVLHLLGFDHEGIGVRRKRAERKMMKLQDELFDRLRKKYDF